MKTQLTSFCLLMAFLALPAQNKPLRFGVDKQFKIVQFTDIHYKPGAIASDTAIILINEVLDAEKPDLVVFTGDLAWGAPARDCFDKVLEPVINRKLPWAYVNGNHDDEQGWTRKQIMDYIVTKPYCLAIHGDRNLKGEGNYILEVKAADGDSIATLLYFMDSGAYNKSLPGVGWSYDWFSPGQIDWYRKQSAAYTAENGGQPYPALAFFHIPLAEYPIMSSAKGSTIIGNRKENECNGKINTGMFAAMIESGDVMGTFVGHDHDNDYIGCYYGIALAYGRYSGGNTVYNNLGLNGCRIISLTQGERFFSTYIRLRGGGKISPAEYPVSFEKDKAK